jgi:hypothetical protein
MAKTIIVEVTTMDNTRECPMCHIVFHVYHHHVLVRHQIRYLVEDEMDKTVVFTGQDIIPPITNLVLVMDGLIVLDDERIEKLSLLK